MGQIHGAMFRVGGDADEAVAQVERFVRKSSVFTAEHDGQWLASRHQLRGRLLRAPPVLLVRPPPRRRTQHVARVGQRLAEFVEDTDPLHDVMRIVRDTRHAPCVEVRRPDQAEISKPHVLHRPNDEGDVHQVLWLVEDDERSV